MADDVLQNTLEVKVNEDTYEFSIPTYLDEIKVGIRSRDLVRTATGNFNNSLEGVDEETRWLINVAARFEVLLKRSSAKWPWSDGPAGKPVVDFQKWPNDKVGEALAAGTMFAAELNRFRSRGIANTDTPSPEAMASEPDSGEKPI